MIPPDTERYRREADFHDRTFAEGSRQVVEGFYDITHSSSKALYRNYLISQCGGKGVLEYGCGPDSHSALMARNGGKVVGIDISPVAVTLNRNEASPACENGVQYCVMNAECLAFTEDSFDIICGMGILHHLDLNASLAEIARVLKPSGSAIFLEPLGHNPLINLYRRLTPQLRTPDEHPLLASDLAELPKYFGRQKITYFHLTSLAATPFRRMRGFEKFLEKLNGLDQWLFQRFSPLRKHAWVAATILSEPRKCTELHGKIATSQK